MPILKASESDSSSTSWGNFSVAALMDGPELPGRADITSAPTPFFDEEILRKSHGIGPLSFRIAEAPAKPKKMMMMLLMMMMIMMMITNFTPPYTPSFRPCACTWEITCGAMDRKKSDPKKNVWC